MSEGPEDTSSLPFDALLARLDGLVGALEAGDLPLEEALKTFEEGMRLAKAGSQRLDAAEKQVERLIADDASGATRSGGAGEDTAG